MPRSRDETLALLRGQPLSRLPVFSGLPSLTAIGLNRAGVRYAEAHTDAAKMAAAAASTFEAFAFESAVVSFDLCVEAEALGCRIDFHGDADAFLPPVVSETLPVEWIDRSAAHLVPEEAARAGRIPLVAEAIRRLKTGVGREVAIGAWIPGPFTLAWQVFGTDAWLASLREAVRAARLLNALAGFLARVAVHYGEAGADFITVHEMGGSPQAIGPARFRTLVQPALARLMSLLPSPNVLSMCGDTNAIVTDLIACGADALSVDQRNDLARTRRMLGPQAILLGNFDPVETLSLGTPQSIAGVVAKCASAGVSAIWPGCDLWPDVPEANFRALIDAARATASYQ
jgi:[methyl-Co(III) methanol-specific corrinoid protein]:coenzyme M methyltransferase